MSNEDVTIANEGEDDRVQEGRIPIVLVAEESGQHTNVVAGEANIAFEHGRNVPEVASKRPNPENANRVELVSEGVHSSAEQVGSQSSKGGSEGLQVLQKTMPLQCNIECSTQEECPLTNSENVKVDVIDPVANVVTKTGTGEHDVAIQEVYATNVLDKKKLRKEEPTIPTAQADDITIPTEIISQVQGATGIEHATKQDDFDTVLRTGTETDSNSQSPAPDDVGKVENGQTEATETPSQEQGNNDQDVTNQQERDIKIQVEVQDQPSAVQSPNVIENTCLTDPIGRKRPERNDEPIVNHAENIYEVKYEQLMKESPEDDVTGLAKIATEVFSNNNMQSVSSFVDLVGVNLTDSIKNAANTGHYSHLVENTTEAMLARRRQGAAAGGLMPGHPLAASENRNVIGDSAVVDEIGNTALRIGASAAGLVSSVFGGPLVGENSSTVVGSEFGTAIENMTTKKWNENQVSCPKGDKQSHACVAIGSAEKTSVPNASGKDGALSEEKPDCSTSAEETPDCPSDYTDTTGEAKQGDDRTWYGATFDVLSAGTNVTKDFLATNTTRIVEAVKNVPYWNFRPGDKFIVQESGAVMRETEALDSVKVMLLPPGVIVTVLELNGRRAKVQTGATQGWISVISSSGKQILGELEKNEDDMGPEEGAKGPGKNPTFGAQLDRTNSRSRPKAGSPAAPAAATPLHADDIHPLAPDNMLNRSTPLTPRVPNELPLSGSSSARGSGALSGSGAKDMSPKMTILVDADEYSRLTKENRVLEKERILLKKQLAERNRRLSVESSSERNLYELRVVLRETNDKYERARRKIQTLEGTIEQQNATRENRRASLQRSRVDSIDFAQETEVKYSELNIDATSTPQSGTTTPGGKTQNTATSSSSSTSEIQQYKQQISNMEEQLARLSAEIAHLKEYSEELEICKNAMERKKNNEIEELKSSLRRHLEEKEGIDIKGYLEQKEKSEQQLALVNQASSSSSAKPGTSSSSALDVGLGDFLYIAKIDELKGIIRRLEASQRKRSTAEKLIERYFEETVGCGFMMSSIKTAGNGMQNLVETILRENQRLTRELRNRSLRNPIDSDED